MTIPPRNGPPVAMEIPDREVLRPSLVSGSVGLLFAGIGALAGVCGLLVAEVSPSLALGLGVLGASVWVPLGVRWWRRRRARAALPKPGELRELEGRLVGSTEILATADGDVVRFAPVRVRLDDGRCLDLDGVIGVEAGASGPLRLRSGQRVRVRARVDSPGTYRESVRDLVVDEPAVIAALEDQG